MAEGAPPETPTAAARLLIGSFASALALRCVETFDPGAYLASAAYGAAAIIVAVADYSLPRLLSGSPQLTRTLNKGATDARCWIGVVLAVFIFIGGRPIVDYLRSLQETALPIASLRPEVTALQSQLTTKAQELTATKEQLTATQQNLESIRQNIVVLTKNQRYVTTGCVMDTIDRFRQNIDFNNLPKILVVFGRPASSGDSSMQTDLYTITEKMADALIPAGREGGPPIQLVNPPDYETYLDAPKLIGSGVKGITIHGTSVLGVDLKDVFSSSFPTHIVEIEDSGNLLTYYHRLNPTYGEYKAIVWIEIAGLPWSLAGHPVC
jgi:hypothetical protein